jgi:transposase
MESALRIHAESALRIRADPDLKHWLPPAPTKAWVVKRGKKGKELHSTKSHRLLAGVATDTNGLALECVWYVLSRVWLEN